MKNLSLTPKPIFIFELYPLTMFTCIAITKNERKIDSFLQSLKATHFFCSFLSVNTVKEALTTAGPIPNFIFLHLKTQGEENEILQVQQAYPSAYIVILSFRKALAYKVIKHQLFDFVLLPLPTQELQRYLIKIQKIIERHKDKIYIRSYKDYKYLYIEDILYLKADNNTTEFYLHKNLKVHGFKTLKTYQNRLPAHFLRIHKSYMVNTTKIWRIHFGKRTCEIMGHSQPLPFSKSFVAKMELLHAHLMKTSY